MDKHEGKGHQSPASKVFMDEAVDGFSILELTQQSRKAIRLIFQRKHCLVNDRKSAWLVSANAPAWEIRSWSTVNFSAFERSAQKLTAIELVCVWAA
jgi:hypothetical protein